MSSDADNLDEVMQAAFGGMPAESYIQEAENRQDARSAARKQRSRLVGQNKAPDKIPASESAATVEHAVDCTCADHGWRDGMRCAMREDWFEGNDPTNRPPPVHRYQHDPDGMAAWARARRRSILPWIRRRAHHAIQYAIYHREVALGWRRGSMTEWVLR